jgi:hypothetical protein
MADRSRYRLINYIGARILQARELNKQQAVDRHADDTITGTYAPSAYEQGAVYREGATFNITATPTGVAVSFAATDSTKPMLVFVRGLWEKLKVSESSTVTLGTIAITSTSRVSNVVTITTSVAHNLVVGGSVTINGVTDSSFNGTFTIVSTPTTTTFTYAQTAANASSSAGTVGPGKVYLNYEVRKITVIDDAQLQDATTLEATAEMGELMLTVSATDTSAVALAGNQFEKNVAPIELFTYINNGVSLVQVSVSNVIPQARANVVTDGLVRLTTSTSSGLAPADDDPRLTDTRTPTNLSVTDAKVRVPVAVSSVVISTAVRATNVSTITTAAPHGRLVGESVVITGVADSSFNGTWVIASVPLTTSFTFAQVAGNVSSSGGSVSAVNSDGTTVYNINTDPGGISAVKIVLKATSQLLEDGWAWLKSKILSVEAAYNAHKNAALGLGNTHPMPTATDVGATPISHVGQPLGLDTTHPLAVSKDTGGFLVNRTGTPTAGDYAYSTVQSGVVQNGLGHDGDIYSILANAFTAAPLVESGESSGALGAGTLGNMSLVAKALAAHLNKTSHKNPHGLTIGDLGGASLGYVDTQDQNILSTALTFAELLGNITVRKVTSISPHAVNAWDDAGWGPGESFRSQGSVIAYWGWMIVTIGGKFELAFGMGTLHQGSSIQLPPADSNGSWSINNCLASAGMGDYLDKNDLNEPSWSAGVASMNQVSDGAGNFRPTTVDMRISNSTGTHNSFAHVTAVAWRFITAPPLLISLAPTTGTTGATLTITGRNFGAVLANAVVTIGGISATVTTCNPTSIQCIIPGAAATGSIAVAVTVAGRAGLNTLTFTKT